MKGDFSRILDRHGREPSGVLFQQGAPIVDADLNRAFSLVREEFRSAVTDIVGWHGAPGEQKAGTGDFAVAAVEGESGRYSIGEGRYYINGLAFEHVAAVGQAVTIDLEIDNLPQLIYLVGWEREVNALDGTQRTDGTTRNSLVDPGLAGATPTLRTESTWKVCAAHLERQPVMPPDSESALLKLLQPDAPRIEMCVRVDQNSRPNDPCVLPPDADYRGTEHQLYRIELRATDAAGRPTCIVWARDNASSTYGIRGEVSDGSDVELTTAVDDRTRPCHNDLVEIRSDEMSAVGATGDLRAVTSTDPSARSLQLGEVLDIGVGLPDDHDLVGPYLRRWTGMHKLDWPVGASQTSWIELERYRDGASEFGIQVAFRIASGSEPAVGPVSSVTPGDYWAIPARSGRDLPEVDAWSPPHGIRRHRAPLALLTSQGKKTKLADMRNYFDQASKPVSP